MSQAIKELFDKELLGDEISALTVLQAGEISAVAAYDQALHRVKDVEVLPILYDCRNSHALRVEILGVRLKDLGAASKEKAGFLAELFKFIEGGATMIGDQTAMKVLSAVENFGSQQYRSCMRALAPDSWKIVEEELLPSQRCTDLTMQFVCTNLVSS